MTAYLGIDLGTQGLSVVLTDERLRVLEVAEGGYAMVSGLPTGHYEQQPADWSSALASAFTNLATACGEAGMPNIAAIGVSGQMHGEVLADGDGNPLGPVRLWCDTRNESEGAELTQTLGTKMPKRITAARWLATTRERPELASRTRFITTPAGWLASQLTGHRTLGVGDASGVFPIEQGSFDYDGRLLELFEQQVSRFDFRKLLPQVALAGDDAGTTTPEAAQQFGLPAGVPVAPAEGDQPAAMAGSLVGAAGEVAVSFGTSVCANSIGDRVFEGVSASIDHFCAVDGKPINMVFLRNGTTFVNRLVHLLGRNENSPFDTLLGFAAAADADCGGLFALPFMDDEPGLNVQRGGTAMLIGLNDGNATPGNVVKSALLSTMFNLKLGCEPLEQQGFPRKRLIFSGGLAKTPEFGQVLADVFACPVTLLEDAAEGTAWGAAVLARYRHLRLGGSDLSWEAFLETLKQDSGRRFEPEPVSVDVYARSFERYRRLLRLNGQLGDAVAID